MSPCPLIFLVRNQDRVKAWLASLCPGAVQVGAGRDQGRSDHAGGARTSRGPRGRLYTSQADLERFIAAWQQWDAFLVLQINALSRHPLSESEHRVLLETLFDARYRFVHEFNDPDLGRKDVVCEQFVTAWTRLAPVMRRHLERETGDARLSYLAFFSAAYALAALDKLGHTLGLDISRNGLIRLACLLMASDKPDLAYSWAVDPGRRTHPGHGSGPGRGRAVLPGRGGATPARHPGPGSVRLRGPTRAGTSPRRPLRRGGRRACCPGLAA